MRLSISFSLAPCSNSGFSVPGVPATASVTWPPCTGPTLGTGMAGMLASHADSSSSPAAKAAAVRCLGTLLDVGLEPDVGDGDDQERCRQHPGGVEELPLQAPAGAVAATQAAVATADGPPQTRRLRRLQQHARHQQDADDHLEDDERVANVGHGTREVYREGRRPGAPPAASAPATWPPPGAG